MNQLELHRAVRLGPFVKNWAYITRNFHTSEKLQAMLKRQLSSVRAVPQKETMEAIDYSSGAHVHWEEFTDHALTRLCPTFCSSSKSPACKHHGLFATHTCSPNQLLYICNEDEGASTENWDRILNYIAEVSNRPFPIDGRELCLCFTFEMTKTVKIGFK